MLVAAAALLTIAIGGQAASAMTLAAAANSNIDHHPTSQVNNSTGGGGGGSGHAAIMAAGLSERRRAQSRPVNCSTVNQCTQGLEHCDTSHGVCSSCATVTIIGAGCGCTDSYASNFNASAGQDDGSCDYSALCASGTGWACSTVSTACQNGHCAISDFTTMAAREPRTPIYGLLSSVHRLYRYVRFHGLTAHRFLSHGGAAIGAQNSNIAIVSTTFSNNNNPGTSPSPGFGGAIYFLNTNAAIVSSEFSGNSAVRGGAIYGVLNCTLRIVSTKFVGNSAVYFGGAIKLEGASNSNLFTDHLVSGLLIFGSTFDSNTARRATHIHTDSMANVKIANTGFNPFIDGSSRSVQIAGVAADCAMHPCALGQQCTYRQYALACSYCPSGTVGLDGMQCTTCGPAKQPSANQTTCVPCSHGSYSTFGVCEICALPRIVTNNGSLCMACAPGSAPDSNRTACVSCSGPTYSKFGVSCENCQSPLFVDVLHTSCEPSKCTPGTICPASTTCSNATMCVPCPVGSVGLGTSCSNCTEPGKVANSEQSSCEACAPGQQPAGNRSGCVDCIGSNHSSFGYLCEPCPSLTVVNSQRSNCQKCHPGFEPSADQARCIPCSGATFSSAGTCLLCDKPKIVNAQRTTCTSCPGGKGPTQNQDECVDCTGHKYSKDGDCVACSDGKEPNQQRTACQECATGRTGKSGRCDECTAGFYAIEMNGTCHPCSSLQLPDRLEQLDVARPSMHSAAVCPGGIPGVSAGICPMQGLWVHYDRTGVPQLLACETKEACVVHAYGSTCNGSALFYERGVALGSNICSNSTTGFMCLQCDDGHSKVGGHCYPCSDFDWPTIALHLLVNFATALFLLHKSTSVTISEHEIELIWYKVDLHRVDSLGRDGIQKVLALMGASVPEDKMTKTLIKDYHAQAPVETATQEEIPATSSDLVVLKQAFISVASKDSPTAAMGTAIFFVQTFGLLAKDASFFGAAELFNLDTEAAAQKCLSPLSYSERYFVKAVLTPIIVCICVFASIPIWNLARKILKKKMHKLPPTIEKIHVRRALVNTFLFCFAPLTRSSVEALVCLDTPSGPVLMADMAVQCYVNQHWYVAGFAILVLFAVAILIPVLLLRLVRQSRRRRDASLHLRADQVDKWFDELDADESGLLDRAEIKVLLERVGEATDEKTLDQFMASVTAGDHAVDQVSKSQFEKWYSEQLTSLVDTPYDVLYGTTHSAAYWWFMQILWLKTLINMLYTFGVANQFQWHIWMHILLTISVVIMVNQRPYISSVDQQVELFALLSLAAVAHISSIFKAGVTWDPAYLVLCVVLFVVPIFTFGGGTFYIRRRLKKDFESSIAKVKQLHSAGKHAVASAAFAGKNAVSRGCWHSCCGNKRRGTAVVSSIETEPHPVLMPEPVSEPIAAKKEDEVLVGAAVDQMDDEEEGQSDAPGLSGLAVDDQQMVDDFMAEADLRGRTGAWPLHSP